MCADDASKGMIQEIRGWPADEGAKVVREGETIISSEDSRILKIVFKVNRMNLHFL